MNILACDLGGTNTRIMLAQIQGNRLFPIDVQRFSSEDYPGLDAIVAQYLSQTNSNISIDRACFAVAAPVQPKARQQTIRITNLPWHIDIPALQNQLENIELLLINDFEAIAYGIECLSAVDLDVLHDAPIRKGAPKVVLGAGTGLGQALLFPQAEHYRVYATEGGHTDFAPCTDLEIELQQKLLDEFEHVSWERLVSGPGLVRIYRFLATKSSKQPSKKLRNAFQQMDPAAAISTIALVKQDSIAEQALALFIQLYGRQAGNLALTSSSSGGLYLAGNIANKILKEQQQRQNFMNAFVAKGRMKHLMQQIPVFVIRDLDIGLKGAAMFASKLDQLLR